MSSTAILESGTYRAIEVDCTCHTGMKHWELREISESVPCLNDNSGYLDPEIDEAVQKINYGKILKKG